MAKKYDLGSKSDMKKFMRDLNTQVINDANKQLQKRENYIACPNCKVPIAVSIGTNICPFCKHKIENELRIDF